MENFSMRLLALLLACSLTTGCASLKRETHTVCVQTEPAGAQVAVLEPDGRKELGPSPAEYKREIDTYRCGNVAWLIRWRARCWPAERASGWRTPPPASTATTA
jgi:hypothetical protein